MTAPPKPPSGTAQPTFFWHDYETFGRDPRRDRPAQFAGIRTDADLNEVGEPVMHYCRPAPDYLPDAESVLLTGIVPQLALERGLPEHAFAAAVLAELGADGTIGVGYNTLRFDDEFTRHLFWRNLIDPYQREWCNDCCRWDIVDLVRACWALRPAGIEWPVHGSGEQAGRPSFKLEHLSAANGLVHDAAHDALSDVRATIALARLIRQRQPRLWEFAFRLRKKDAVLEQIGGFAEPRPFVHLSSRYPLERGSLAIAWPLAPHPSNRNEVIVWDLAHDPRELATLDVEAVRRRVFTRADDLPEGETRLPIKTIHINRSPFVCANLGILDAATRQRWGLDVDAALRHAGHAAALGRSLDPLWAQAWQRPPEATVRDVDEDLYGGFLADADRRTLERLRALSPEALPDKRPAFDDARLEELVFRYRARNFPDTLAAGERQRWLQHCAERLHGGAAGHPTLAAWLERIDGLAEAAMERGDDRAQALLEALVDYAEAIAPEAAA
jgi:exodeoxyribonuclease-1